MDAISLPSVKAHTVPQQALAALLEVKGSRDHLGPMLVSATAVVAQHVSVRTVGSDGPITGIIIRHFWNSSRCVEWHSGTLDT